jgi:endonuclease/exonuclease/phosphatase family metal-dependent hydrolase
MGGRSGLGLELLFLGLAALFFWVAMGAGPAIMPSFDPQQRAPGSLRVVTWNVGSGVDAGTGALRDGELEHVARVIGDLDGDLVFLQELGGRGQMSALGRALGPAWSWRFTIIDSGRPMGVLAQRGKLRQRRAPEIGGSLLVRFSSNSGSVLECVALHVDAFSSESRNQNIGLASDYLEEVKVGERPLLLGDLNLDLGIDKRRDLFTDDEYLDVETYNYVANRMLDTGLEAGPTAKPDRRIDYIFARPGDFTVTQVGPWLGQRARGMDHHPLVVDLVPQPED